MRRHILICGDRGVGKSTLIRRLLEGTALQPGGFYTKMEPEAGDILRSVYLFPADVSVDCRSRRPENLVGRCAQDGCREIYPEVFDTVGVACLQRGAGKNVIVMDELGFMEASAAVFCQTVLEKLNGDVPVLAAVKKREDVSFLRQVCTHPHGEVIEITPENRDALYSILLPVVQGWKR